MRVLNDLARKSEQGTPLSEQVRHKIREMIYNRTLAGGHVIIEQRLAEELGVSRTPLREALQRLEGEGMVEKSSGRSYLIRKVDFQEYMQSFKVRLLLEPEAAALAAGRIPREVLMELNDELRDLQSRDDRHTNAHWRSDDHLHQMVGAHCGNNVLYQTVEELRVTTRLYEIEDVRQQVEKDLEQHLDVVAALISGDGAQAKRAMRTHIKSLIAHSLKQVR